MLFALLYDHSDRVIAAAPACDQISMGDRYWLECHPATISATDVFATAYREIRDRDLQKRLLDLGIDDQVHAAAITTEVESLDYGGVRHASNRAA